jgi:hypothetical protein
LDPELVLSFDLLVAANVDLLLELCGECLLQLLVILFQVFVIFKECAAIVGALGGEVI